MNESATDQHTLHVASPVPLGKRLLRPGLTCWRLEPASRFAPIIDAASYFRLLRDALLKARHSVIFIGWEFDTRIELDPDAASQAIPRRLGGFLSALKERRPDLRIHVLQWNLGLLGTLLRGTTPLHLLNWMSRKRFEFRLDSAHPTGASQHQKIVVIDDALAFCGGIDMTADRWDTSDHSDDDVRRTRPSGDRYGAFHDATVAVGGAAAAALGELARERWRAAGGKQIPLAPRFEHDLWPSDLPPLLREVEVAIARTAPAYRGRPAVREVEALHLAAIASARRSIYIESQYFAARCIGEAIAKRLEEADGPEIVVINPREARGWLEERVMGSARSRLLGRIRAADRHDRFRIYRPVTAAGEPIYVHAKVLVIDDRLLRIGSANINNRSMGLDAECDVAIETLETADGGNVGQSIRAVRERLVAEHLDVNPAELQAALAEHRQSLVQTIERLRCPAGRTLVPLEMPAADGRPLDEGELLDPEQAESLPTMLRHAMRARLRALGRSMDRNARG